jgi:predicted alpha/beta superfamily hydrolase
MKKALLLVVVVSITAVLSFTTFSILSDYDSEDQVGVIRTKLSSKILGEERELVIHLPRGYDSARTYPVMYVLDGGSLDWHIATNFDILSTAGYSPQTIVVGIPNMSAENREKNLTPPFMRRDNDNPDSESGQADIFLDFLETELIPFIENNYSASSIRLISGNSRGGLLVMYSLLHQPNLFQARFCYSPPFWRQDNILVSKVHDFINTKDTLDTFLFMSAGQNETENIKNGLREMAKILNRKTPVGLKFHWEYTSLATHQNNATFSMSAGIARWSEYFTGNNPGH